jgi:hypothetical protein
LSSVPRQSRAEVKRTISEGQLTSLGRRRKADRRGLNGHRVCRARRAALNRPRMSLTSATRPPLCDSLSVILPTPEQTALLRALLLSGEEGRQASERWLKQRQGAENSFPGELSKSLLPLLSAAVRRNGVGVDGPFLTVLRSAALREELRTKTYRRICHEVLSALTAAEIPIVALKGAVLADTVYSGPALRHSHDIDILLGEPDPSRAIGLVSSLGFAPPKEKLGPGWQDLRLEHESGLSLVFHRHFFRIPLYNTAAAEMWARSQTQVITGVPVRTLSPADQLLHVCGHAASCASRESLRWVCDAWFLIGRYGELAWDVGLDCAVRNRLALPLSVTCGYLAEELRAPIPATFLRRLYTAASRATTVECEVALWGARAGARGGYKNLLRASEDWHTRAFVLKWMVFPSPAYLCSAQLLRHPWQLPFYHLSRPLRYIARRIRLKHPGETSTGVNSEGEVSRRRLGREDRG